jgi:hypothetical protein
MYCQRIQSMFKSRRGSIPAILAVGGLVWAGPATTFAQDRRGSEVRSVEFNNASVIGDYAIVGTYGPNVAQELGTQKVDGFGEFVGSSILNQPGPSGTRTILNVTFTGSYTVYDDGKGVDSFTVVLPDGRIITRTEDFVITKTQVNEGTPIATEIVGALREPSGVVPGGVFVTHTYTRLPSAKEDERGSK